ncbi:MAG: nuclear transport factor 2 family protein [Phaeodactylibacter sp.]|nr:nuclear transport factor 2 family protein [Phaeodactylibacter sp.]MCB9286542.1 nuclear transport factor 2 family protein [Lewinellaceae bacterium]
MHPNEELIHTFYRAFQRKDYESMKKCYHPEAEFSDEVFRGLNAYETGMMWEMLVKSGRDLELQFSGVEAGEKEGKAVWEATYTFSKKKRKVVNRIIAGFEFKDGKIFRHTDQFNFYRWARQAFGVPGLLLGWTGFFKAKVQAGVRERLREYIKEKSTDA